MSTAKPAQVPGIQPRIPERWLDVPSQRLYALSVGLLCQVSLLLQQRRSLRSRYDAVRSACCNLSPLFITTLIRDLLCKAIKLLDFIRYSFTSNEYSTNYGRKWILADFAFCVALSQLRIPRLHYSKAVVLIQIISLCFIDGVVFGGIHLNLFGGSTEGTVSNTGFSSMSASITFGR